MSSKTQVSVELPAGTYYFGDICYAMNEEIYDSFWGEECKYADGAWDMDARLRLDKKTQNTANKKSAQHPATRNAIEDIGDIGDYEKPKKAHNRIFAVGRTAFGDGEYPGLQKSYLVDAGVLGVVSASLIDPEKMKKAKELGLIFTSKTPIHFISDGEGHFEIYDRSKAIEEVDTGWDEEEEEFDDDENLEESIKKDVMKLTEGRKSNILKVLSQLHAYLKRYQDLDKTEIHFEQRLEDAGCTDMYAVIDDVLDIVETAKPKEKARLLNRVYKAYFPKTANKDPASDEEVEIAMGEEDNEDEGTQVEGQTQIMTLGDLRKGKAEPSGEKTLGDVRKDDEEYLTSSESEDFYEDEGDSDRGDDLQSDLDRSRGKLDDLEESMEEEDEDEDGDEDEVESWTQSDMEKGVRGRSAARKLDDLEESMEDEDGDEDEDEVESWTQSDMEKGVRGRSAARQSGQDRYGNNTDLDNEEDGPGSMGFEESVEDDESKYTIDDLEPGMIVNCGAYGDGIIVCAIHDDHRFWGTDDVEEYKENGANAPGWYFDVSTIEDITGAVGLDEENDNWEDQADRREMDSTFGDHDDNEIEETIKAAKLRAHILEGGSGWGDADIANEDYDDMGPVDDFEPPERSTAGTRHPEDIMDSMNDEAFAYIEELKSTDSGITDEELIEEIVKEFSDPEHPMENGMALDILEDYYTESDPANEKATSGQIENEYDELAIDGVPDGEIVKRLTRKYDLTHHELKMILGDNRERKYSYKDEGPDEVDEYPLDDTEDIVIPNWDGEIHDEDEDENDLLFEESALLPHNFKALASQVYTQLAQGKPENSISMNLKDRGFSDHQINQVLDYIAFKQPETERPLLEGMPGPSDQHAGQSTQEPMRSPTPGYDTAPADLGQGTTAANPNENTNNNQPATPGSPPEQDQTQQLLQNPEFADFFQAMSKINPGDLQNLTQALGQK